MDRVPCLLTLSAVQITCPFFNKIKKIYKPKYYRPHFITRQEVHKRIYMCAQIVLICNLIHAGASQLLLQKIRQFEQLAELDPSDVDAATTATEEASCHIAESDMEDETVQDLLCVLQVSSPVAACRFQKLLEDFFREGLASSCHRDRSHDSETTKMLLATAKSWLDGRHRLLRSDCWKAEVEEMERLGWWRRFREDEQEMLAVDVECAIFWSLMEELVDDLC